MDYLGNNDGIGIKYFKYNIRKWFVQITFHEHGWISYLRKISYKNLPSFFI